MSNLYYLNDIDKKINFLLDKGYSSDNIFKLNFEKIQSNFGIKLKTYQECIRHYPKYSIKSSYFDERFLLEGKHSSNKLYRIFGEVTGKDSVNTYKMSLEASDDKLSADSIMTVSSSFEAILPRSKSKVQITPTFLKISNSLGTKQLGIANEAISEFNSENMRLNVAL